MTQILCLAIVLVSIMGFNNRQVVNNLILHPYTVIRHKEWYRLASCALIHADYMHLIFNMLALYTFGQNLEVYLRYYYPSSPTITYIALLLGGQLASVLPTVFRHRDNSYYYSLGASGMVTAVILASVIFNPWSKVLFFFVPMPGILFALLYMVYEYYAGRNVQDNVNHDAHYYGGLFGALFILLTNTDVAKAFFAQLQHPTF